jgi:opacity protein-like surface antigen
MTFVARVASAAALIVLTLLPLRAEAQEQRFSISFTPAWVSVGGDGEFGVATSLGYRFSEHFSFEGDFTWVDGAAAGLGNGRVFSSAETVRATSVIGSIIGGTVGTGRGNMRNNPMPLFDGRLVPITPFLPGPAAFDGSTMIGTLGVRYEPAVQTERFRPFLSAGVGLNYTDVEFSFDRETLRAAAAFVDFEESFSHTGMAFSAGGGASFRIVNSLWANVDAKYFRLSRDRNLMRLGGGVTLRF